jgi:hypothetical protein
VRAEYGHGFLSAPDDDNKMMFQWLHVRAGESCFIVFGDKAPLWYKAHWYDGRMQPCKGEDCRLCSAGVGRQRRWVFAVRLTNSEKAMLWEVSESLAQDIRKIAAEFNQLEGLKMYVSREGSGRKGRLSISGRGMEDALMQRDVIFPEPQEALELTWSGLERQSECLAEERTASAESGRERYPVRGEY